MRQRTRRGPEPLLTSRRRRRETKWDMSSEMLNQCFGLESTTQSTGTQSNGSLVQWKAFSCTPSWRSGFVFPVLDESGDAS